MAAALTGALVLALGLWLWRIWQVEQGAGAGQALAAFGLGPGARRMKRAGSAGLADGKVALSRRRRWPNSRAAGTPVFRGRYRRLVHHLQGQ